MPVASYRQSVRRERIGQLDTVVRPDTSVWRRQTKTNQPAMLRHHGDQPAMSALIKQQVDGVDRATDREWQDEQELTNDKKDV